MSRVYAFADETGNFDFSRGPKASRYFILTTATFGDGYALGDALQRLRLDLAWEGVELKGPFHATTDAQAVRDRVFAALGGHQFRLDATILEKPKAKPGIRITEERFYQIAWYFHMKHVAPLIARRADELMLVAASIGTKKKRAAFYQAVQDVMRQVGRAGLVRTAFWDAACDPHLQAADYCAWALGRKWESGDLRSYNLIRQKIRSEFDLFAPGTRTYY
jgi:hypothetical protein